MVSSAGFEGNRTGWIGDVAMKALNAEIVDEFRAHGGRVGGPFEGAPMLLLHHIGARTGRARVTPLVYLPDGIRMVVFATKAGDPSNPDWYHNLVAHSRVTIEVGNVRREVRAVLSHGREREHLYARMAMIRPEFTTYEKRAGRQIPVIALQPLSITGSEV